MRHNTVYTMIFASLVCVVCGVFVSSTAVSLLEAQQTNAALDRQKNVLEAAGLIEAGQKVTPEEIATLSERVVPVALDLTTGETREDFQLEGYDPIVAAKDPAQSFRAPQNRAAVTRVPEVTTVYEVKNDAGETESIVLPIWGLGLWGTLYGFLAVDPDDNQIQGITYYQHKETPGLGGEVDNPIWKARWPGRKIYQNGEVGIEVIKGAAGPAEENPYQVDGLSGATITGRGVSNMLEFWLGPELYGQYLDDLGAPVEAS